mgnify:CR=1 FL=1
MSLELRTKPHVSVNVIENGFLLEVFAKGSPSYGDATEHFYPTLEDLLAGIKEVLL